MDLQKRQGSLSCSFLALTFGLLAGCGGGGSGSDTTPGGNVGGTPGPSGNETVPISVSGFQRQGSADALFYTQVLAGNNMAGLFMVSPSDPSIPKLVDGDIGPSFFTDLDASPQRVATITADNYDRLFLTFYGAELDQGTNSLTSIRAAEVLYGDGSFFAAQSQGYKRVTVDGTATAPTPVAVTNQEIAPEFFSARILNNLLQVEDTHLLYLNISSDWQQFQLSDDGSTLPVILADGLDPFSVISDFSALEGLGYLVVDENLSQSIRFVDVATLAARPGAVTEDGAGTEMSGILSAADLRMSTNDGGVYIGLSSEEFENIDDKADVWLYQYSDIGPGVMTAVRDAFGAQLQVGRNLFTGDALVPSDTQQTVLDGNPYFLNNQSATDSIDVIGLDGSEWRVVLSLEGAGSALLGLSNAFLMSAGNRIAVEHDDKVISVRADGTDVRILDSTTAIGGQSISTPVTGSDGTWIYYNRQQGIAEQEFAVALNLVTDERLDIPDWQWVGASSARSSQTGARLSSPVFSEVFMIGPGAELAAVRAEDPAAGKVNFGALPNAASEVRFMGVAPGPQRLVQTVASGEPETYEVAYLDVRDEFSMQVVTAQSSENAAQRPLSQF